MTTGPASKICQQQLRLLVRFNSFQPAAAGRVCQFCSGIKLSLGQNGISETMSTPGAFVTCCRELCLLACFCHKTVSSIPQTLNIVYPSFLFACFFTTVKCMFYIEKEMIIACKIPGVLRYILKLIKQLI